MQKTKIRPALAIVVIATAVVLIGGLAVIPTTIQSANADSSLSQSFEKGIKKCVKSDSSKGDAKANEQYARHTGHSLDC
jgi:uncharacterized protein YecT (DUF1311 family)